ncbi:MAG TPA: hypothetical protein VKX16_03435, partial [Chloroflexota bacterium]|nr:hypothetical protein [Chloroflexota bacterium]
LPAAIAAFTIAMLPFAGHWSSVVEQTITFQRTRWLMDWGQRAGTTLVWWAGENVFAFAGAIKIRAPTWLVAGFGLGIVFILPSQVYYHYFVPVAPFGALLGGPILASLLGARVRIVLPAAGLLVSVTFAEILSNAGPAAFYVTAARFSDVGPVTALIRSRAAPGTPVLADRLEYAYLSGRPAAESYFWNIGVLVDAHYLQHHFGRTGVVVLSRGASSGFPTGFIESLRCGLPRQVALATVWAGRTCRTEKSPSAAVRNN